MSDDVTDERRARKAAYERKRLQDPEKRARHNERVREYHRTPEVLARRSAPAYRARINERARQKRGEAKGA